MNLLQRGNMPAKFSSEARIRERKDMLGVSAAFLAATVGIPQSVLSDAFRGVRSLSNAKGEELLALTSELIMLTEALRPLSMPFHNADETIRLLDHLHKNNITPEIIRQKITELFGEADQRS
jgi:hypothetical protein